MLASGVPEFASLDHDLGLFEPEGGDGVRFTQWLLMELKVNELNLWPVGLRIHSSNTWGVANMLMDADQTGLYRQNFGIVRGESPRNGWPSIDERYR